MNDLSIAFSSKRSIGFTVLILFSILLFSGVALAEDDDEMGWFIAKGTPAKNLYMGLGLGLANNDSPDSNQDGSVTGVNTDENAAKADLFIGYQLHENFAIQGGYTDFGDSEFSGTSSGGPSWAAGPVRTEQEADAWDLGIMGRWPVSDRWYALGFIGWSWWESKETYHEGAVISSIEESGSDVTYALGFEFDHGLTDRIVYRFMGSHHEVGNDEYDINSATAAIVYRFP